VPVAKTRVAFGEVPEYLELRENGASFRVSATGGQKTGWFYDHRMNRRRVAELARGQRVLDVFSYVGGWGVQAAVAGARAVTCIDSSQPALELAAANAALNGVAERMDFRAGNAFDALHALAQAGERYDIVVLDPPAFIKRRRDQKSGERLSPPEPQAASLLADDDLVSALLDASRGRVDRYRAHGGLPRRAAILEVAGQGPVHRPSAIPRRYLKTMSRVHR
jgi:23S rRNA (cytosine1962-C5)-methyltransferase